MFSKPQMQICLLSCACVLSAFAKTGQDAAKKSGSISVTGCLQKGRTLDRFHLIGKDGKTYALRSTSLRLSEHVGHTVRVKGQLKHDQKRDDYDFEGSEVNEGDGKTKMEGPVDMEVTSLRMVDGSCR
jgi:hypothetical protein